MGAPRAPTDPRRDRLKGADSVPPTVATAPGEIWVGALPAAERAAFKAALHEGRKRGQAEREAQDASSREEFEHAVRTLPDGDRIPDLVRPITEGRPATGAEWVLLRELQEVAEREQRRQAVDQVKGAAGPGVRPDRDASKPEPQPPDEGSDGQPSVPRQRRPRGRRKGRSVARDEIFKKFRSLRANYGRNPTQRELADNLSPRIEPRTLQQHLTDYGLPWPIE